MSGERVRGRRFRRLPLRRLPLGLAAGFAVLSAAAIASAAEPAAPATTHAPVTDEALDALLNASPRVQAVLIALKYVPPLIGLGLLIAAIVKRSVTPKELLPPPGPPPVSLFGKLAPQLDVVGAIGVFIAAQVIAAIALAVTEVLWPGSSEVSGVRIICTSMGFVPVAAWILFRRAKAHRATPQGLNAVAEVFGEGAPVPGPSKRRWLGGAAWTYCVASAGVFAATVVAAVFFWLVLHRKPVPQELVIEVLDPALPIDPWLIFGFGVFVAPFTEELLFRGTLYPAIRRWIGPRGAAVIVSAVFAAVHRDLAAALPLFVLAMALTWLFERTDSILAPVAVHAMNNATSLIPLLMISGTK